ncbi:MAG: DNA replication and repair protein RecF, partial [Candidatus Omnitrophica bacterium]|nr:DNA replication and repair protein RecF [Candidatus Omnitrophota bacterium]
MSAGLDGKTRRFRLDGEVLTKSAELYGHLRAVFFSPEDLEFVSGSPNVRRRALDLGLCQKQPRMIGHLLDYRRVLKQRNATLKQNSRNKDIAALLQAWEP